MIKALFLFVAGFVFLSSPCFSETEPQDLQLFLLIGQSNMAGRGKIEPKDKVTHPQIYRLNQEGLWELAQDPLHFDKPSAGVGLGSEFARQLVAADPQARIGLIPCAMGGSSLSEWKPGETLYQNAVDRTRLAMKNGTLAGILWHQGESDSGDEKKIASYAQRFGRMIGQLRKDLSAESVPVIVGELGYFRPTSAQFNAALPLLVKTVPHCALVTAEDLTDGGDQTHLDSASLHILGTRYAQAFLKLKAEMKEP
jgi:hypothetical protein